MNVVRVHDDKGSHIEPACDEAWSDFDKLRWWAAVASADSGLRVTVSDAGDGRYSTSVGASFCSPRSFRSAWDYLSGVITGAEQVHKTEAVG